MQRILVRDFRLDLTLESGQFFRYYAVNGWYYVHVRNCVLKIKQVDDFLYFEGKHRNGKELGKSFLVKLFRLDEDYKNILNSILVDENMKKAVNECKGLRLMRQDPFECLVSFICSSASNIPKIQKNLHLLSQKYGEPLALGNHIGYTFPEPGSIKSENGVRETGVGYRAPYLYVVSNYINDNDLELIRYKSYEGAKKELVKLPGVGDKVADCVLLFSMDFLNAFPVDTWVKKVMTSLYFKKKVSDDTIREFARDYFGENAGYAQQFLFHWWRTKKDSL